MVQADLFAGAFSGAANCVLLQPLDVVKTRMQQSHPTPRLRSVFFSIIRNEGALSLWKGTVSQSEDHTYTYDN